MAKILILSTAHEAMGETGKKTGVWYEELATPYYAFTDAGHDVHVATLDGSAIPIDPNSDETGADAPESVTRFRGDDAAQSALNAPAKLSDFTPESVDAVYIPGGHGAMWDLAESDALAAFLRDAWEAGKVVASVCHGPAAFVNFRDAKGEPVVKGRKVAAFTDSEENAVGLADVVPFLLETRLRELGAEFDGVADWQPHAVADGKLVTGQNPASSGPAADLVLKALG
ncbi:type 1 glutamine amidotransferase domain-containing protein [Halovulum sp. GXIMD14794]